MFDEEAEDAESPDVPESSPQQKPKRRSRTSLDTSFGDSQASTSSEPSPKRRKSVKRKKTAPTTIMVVETDQREVQEEEVQNACKWKKKQDISHPPLPEYVHKAPPFVPDAYVYFRMFFTDELLESISYQTNLYATQQSVNTTFKTSPEEIMNYIAVLLYMGVVPLPSLDDYWSVKTRVPQVASIMSSKRFRLLRRTIHFNDNSQIPSTVDRFYKIRPVLNALREEFLKVQQTPKQSVDEVMVGYKGKMAGNLRQYIRSKPTKWGYKLFCRASSDGFVHDLILYQGATTFPSHPSQLEEDEKKMSLSCQVVSVLARSMTSSGTSGIYADNYFTSLDLVRHLQKKGIRYTGTARDNRIGKPCLKTNEAMGQKSVKRGEVDYCSSDDGIVALKWKDNKVVTVLSSDRGVEPMGKVKRYCKETKKKEPIPCPSVILSYNAHMGGIDKSDMLVTLYKTPMKSKRWYLRLFAYCIDVAVVNAWLLYRRDCVALDEKWISLKQFRLHVYSAASANNALHNRATLTRNHPACKDVELPPPTLRGQRSELPDATVRFDRALFHCPLFSDARQTCKHCSKKGNVMRSNFICSVCKVHFCLNKTRNCFRDFHKPVA